MNTKISDELKQLAYRYSKHGVTFSDLLTIYNSGAKYGITGKKALIGLRMSLAKEFSEREYFSSEDVALVTGESIEEVNKRIEEHEDELLENGDIVKISFPYF